MGRQRILLLVLLLGLFGLVGAWRVYDDVRISQSHYLGGLPPKDILSTLIPKEVDPSLVRAPAVLPEDQTRYGSVTSSIVSVIQYGDYQCEACREFSQTAKQVVASYGGQVRYVWKDMPLAELHDRAMDAAIFARCAGQQGKFWQVHDMLIESGALEESSFRSMTNNARLDPAKLDACRADPAVRAALETDVEFAKSEGINSVPFVFVGTKGFVGAVTAEELRAKLEAFAQH